MNAHVVCGWVCVHMLCGVGGGWGVVDLLHIIMSLFLDMQLSRLPMQVPISGRRD